MVARGVSVASVPRNVMALPLPIASTIATLLPLLVIAVWHGMDVRGVVSLTNVWTRPPVLVLILINVQYAIQPLIVILACLFLDAIGVITQIRVNLKIQTNVWLHFLARVIVKLFLLASCAILPRDVLGAVILTSVEIYPLLIVLIPVLAHTQILVKAVDSMVELSLEECS